jgi:formylglycine-generating enzyme required for sulfatase activity
MQFRSAIPFFLLLSFTGPVQAQLSPGGILEVYLKAREAADAPSDQKVTLYQKSKALVIGMDHYSSGWPQLSNGVKDAEEVAKGLAAQGFEVTFKKDLKSSDLDTVLRNFFIADGSDPNARLLLWFAGHGDTIDGEAYLVPTDAPLPKADYEFRLKAISLRRFGEYMREAKARHVLAIFDSCFSGSVFNVARSLPPPAITLATTQPVREFISSGEAEQQVSDDGTFRKLFLDVLAGKEPDADANHDGYVTGTELGLFMHQKMTNLTNNRQTPRYGKLNVLGYDRGDFVFQVGKPDVPTAAPPTTQPTNDAAQAWAAAQGTTSKAVLEDFIKRYGESFYGTLARARLDEFKNKQVVAVPPVQSDNATASAAKSQDEMEKLRHELARDIAAGVYAHPTGPKMAVVSTPTSPASPCSSSQAMTVSWSSRQAKPLSAEEVCALKPKDVFKECDKCPEMVLVRAGSFNMGSPASESGRHSDEGPQHQVSFSRPFAVGKFAVTFDEWDACVADGGCNRYKPSDQDWGRGRRPVINVNWDDAKAYVAWTSRKTGKQYRLLSEAEREYVTRAGVATPFWWGSTISTSQGNYDGNYFYGSGRGAYLQKTMPVDSFEPNSWGLYQVHGNVYDWVEDCYHDSYTDAPTDASAWTSGGDCSRRVLRGGSWTADPVNLRSASRARDSTVLRGVRNGFRVARTLTP